MLDQKIDDKFNALDGRIVKLDTKFDDFQKSPNTQFKWLMTTMLSMNLIVLGVFDLLYITVFILRLILSHLIPWYYLFITPLFLYVFVHIRELSYLFKQRISYLTSL
ncbi:hypothetical protein BU047_08200 [Staphylococcus simulans]|nr:hypothetical protein BU047_08200 [Staphylococcus simulans]PTJ14838.1 hypothetical protein BU037_12390 [Staphylococcus simulans]PTJ46302.1 hypothetical protein BU014_09555 [Staphylococcus simulans]PTJ85773.1 hypothetical protein BU051_07850 [Staphylococcus simulans]